MENRRFITDRPEKGNRVFITGDELHHLKTVNRAKSGVEVEVIDGKGALYIGRIQALSSHEAVVEIMGRETRERPAIRMTIAPSLIKKKAMAVLVEKLAEMGVDEIRPVVFTRTDEKYGPSLLKKWQRIVMQALKVNKKLWPTVIYPPVNLHELIENTRDAGTKILLHVDGDRVSIPGICQRGGNVVSVIGPPGDFLPEERTLLKENGFSEINLNDGILKTETAAMSIAAILTFYTPQEGGFAEQ